jgi:hypothetical protein
LEPLEGALRVRPEALGQVPAVKAFWLKRLGVREFSALCVSSLLTT